jgi:hypothetical protein
MAGPMTTEKRTHPTPPGWTQDSDDTGSPRLTYAVRGGAKQAVLVALAAALLLTGLYGMYFLLEGGGLTIAGFVLLLVPAGIALFGIYVLDIALVVQDRYVLGSVMLAWSRASLFGRKSLEIPLAAVDAIHQQYSPPGDSAAAGDPGDWTTFVTHRALDGGKVRDFAIAGMTTPSEARWLGPLLAQWAGLPLKRGFGPAFEEADPAELPDPS